MPLSLYANATQSLCFVGLRVLSQPAKASSRAASSVSGPGAPQTCLSDLSVRRGLACHPGCCLTSLRRDALSATYHRVPVSAEQVELRVHCAQHQASRSWMQLKRSSNDLRPLTVTSTSVTSAGRQVLRGWVTLVIPVNVST